MPHAFSASSRSSASGSRPLHTTNTGTGAVSAPRAEGGRSGSSTSAGGRRRHRGSGGSGAGSNSGNQSGRSSQQAGPTLATRSPRPAVTSFDGLPTALVTALRGAGITEPFAIQQATLPDALAGENLLGRAQTGAGKTLGFGLPMLARLHNGRRMPGRPRGLVLAPTRELAQQIADALTPLARPMGLRLTTVYGGAGMGGQISALRGGVDLVIATPGRLTDLLERRALTLDAIEVSVLDEADHMCDLGFLPVVRRLLALTPADCQRLLFSATLDGGVDVLVREYLPNPVLVAVDPPASPVTTMTHHAVEVADLTGRLELLTQLCAGPGRTLVFSRTKHGADRLARQLGNAGLPTAALHGGMAQNARTRALGAFSAGSTRVLVATDVAARGIHVDDIELVVHADPPADGKTYLHRSGRTARAGAGGTVVMLSMPAQQKEAGTLLRQAGIDLRPEPVHAQTVVEVLGTEPSPLTPQRPTAPIRTQAPPARSGGTQSPSARRNRPVRSRRPAHSPAA